MRGGDRPGAGSARGQGFIDRIPDAPIFERAGRHGSVRCLPRSQAGFEFLLRVGHDLA